jgi:cell filamentation protein
LAGELRTVYISKGGMHFCDATRIEADSTKLFRLVASAGGFEAVARSDLVVAVAELHGDLNIIHRFRDGNGRAQRILFEHLIINAGYQIDWWGVGEV